MNSEVENVENNEPSNETRLDKSIKMLNAMEKKPTKKEWDKIALEKDLLPSLVLKFATGKDISELFEKESVRKNEKKVSTKKKINQKNNVISEIVDNRDKYKRLLLEADPDENMIDKYLHSGRMFGLYINNVPICVAVVVEVDKNICELKNIVTNESMRNKGYAKRMIKFLFRKFNNYNEMIVGTSETMIPFYVLNGFTIYSHKVKNFFIDNYKEQIFEGNEQCVDMFYLAKRFQK